MKIFAYLPVILFDTISFRYWKKQTFEYYTSKPVTHKEIEELDFETQIISLRVEICTLFSDNPNNQSSET